MLWIESNSVFLGKIEHRLTIFLHFDQCLRSVEIARSYLSKVLQFKNRHPIQQIENFSESDIRTRYVR